MKHSGSYINETPEEEEKEAGEGSVGKPVAINTERCTKMEILEMKGYGGHFPIESAQRGALTGGGR